jgi:hypothetical protein
VHSKSFDDMYETLSAQVKRAVLDYVQKISDPVNGTIGDTKQTIRQDSDGYPKAPESLQWDKVTKADLEPLFRSYITQHYRESSVRWPAADC